MTASAPAIRIESLSKTYAGKGAPPKLALDDVSLDVPRGQIFGLLGPNGAGKSSEILPPAGLVVKTGGKVSIWGFDIDQHPRNSKRSIGVVPQEIIFDPFFTPRETLEIQAGLYGVAPQDRKSDELLAAMHLTDKANAYARTLSGGMKRRLLVAKAMTHSPPILVLDEPTAGVDVELRQQLWELRSVLERSGRHSRTHHPLSRRSRAIVRPYRDHQSRPGHCERADARACLKGAGKSGCGHLRS
jgi:ABC-2 type transport system ATP-binding protein